MSKRWSLLSTHHLISTYFLTTASDKYVHLLIRLYVMCLLQVSRYPRYKSLYVYIYNCDWKLVNFASHPCCNVILCQQCATEPETYTKDTVTHVSETILSHSGQACLTPRFFCQWLLQEEICRHLYASAANYIAHAICFYDRTIPERMKDHPKMWQFSPTCYLLSL